MNITDEFIMRQDFPNERQALAHLEAYRSVDLAKEKQGIDLEDLRG